MSDSDEDFASADEGDLDVVADGAQKPERPEVKKASRHEDAKGASGESETSKLKHDKKSNDQENKASGSVTPDESEDGKGSSAKAESKPQGGKGKKGKQKGSKGRNKQANKDESAKTVTRTVEHTEPGKDTDKQGENVEKTDKKSATDIQESEGTKVVKSPSAKEKSPEIISSDESKLETASKKDSDTALQRNNEEKSKNLQSVEKETVENTLTKSEKDEPGTTMDKLSAEQKAAMLKSPSSQSISRPEPDHTEQQEEVLERLASSAHEKKSGWGWGWGSSLLEVASTSVSTFSHHVGEGLHTVIETVESTLNVPNPEELALRRTAEKDADSEEADNDQGSTSDTAGKTSKAEEKEKQSSESENQSGGSGDQSSQGVKPEAQSGGGWFSGWGVSSITKKIESTGKQLVTGSLDVLETLGKKTFDVINDHDPGLKKARAFLHDRGDKPNLSAVLRDAKEQQETRTRQEKESEEARKAHFGSLFDDFQGLAHLEALEMLSNQSEKRVNTLLQAIPPDDISKLKPLLLAIKQNFEIDDDEEEEVDEQEFELLVRDLLKQLNVGTTADKIVKTHASIQENLEKCCGSESKMDIKEIHQVAISSLAEFTSKCIEQFHKAGELILTQKSAEYDFKESSCLLHRFTKVLTAEVGMLSTKFSDCLNKHESDGEIRVNHLVTNIYLEASNSSSYIQDGFRLLLPVLQQAAIESNQEPES